MRWLELVWFAPLFVGIGCGGNVSFNTSAGGAASGTSSSAGGTGTGASGGAGGANGGAGPSSSVSSGGSMGGTGGTGGGTACDQACMKAGSCGLPANQCQQFVNCGNAQGACLAGCINDPNVTCQDLNDALQGKQGPLTMCLQGCQGGQVSTSTGVGGGQGGAGGGPSMQCQQCGQNNCANAFFQCVQNAGFMTCQSWQQCVGKCSDSVCFDACNAMYPAAAPVAQCACTSCAMECGAVCGGSSVSSSVSVSSSAATTGSGGGNAMQCQQCGQQQCSAEVQQCFGGGFNACQAWLNCTQPCMSKACIDDCSAKNPAGATLGVCICDKCAAGGCGYTCN